MGELGHKEMAEILNAKKPGPEKPVGEKDPTEEEEEKPLLVAIGKGGHGKVYKYTRGQEVMAVKISPVNSAVYLNTYLLRELVLLQYLQGHPNIITYYRYELDDQAMKIYLECGESSLSDYQPAELQPWISSLMHQMLSAVDFCHRRQVIHRDIKNNNFVLWNSPEGGKRIKLIDFGLASFTLTPCEPTAGVGVVTYKAPELYLADINQPCPPGTITRKPWYTSAIDLWALGCIFHWLLYEYFIFPSEREVMDFYLLNPSSTDFFASLPRTEINPLAQDLLYQLLRPIFSDRISSSEALKHPYFQECEHISDGTYTPPGPYLIPICADASRFHLLARMYYKMKKDYHLLTILTVTMLYDRVMYQRRLELILPAERMQILEICMSLGTKLASSYQEYAPEVEDILSQELEVLQAVKGYIEVPVGPIFPSVGSEEDDELILLMFLAHYFGSKNLFNISSVYLEVSRYYLQNRSILLTFSHLVLDSKKSNVEAFLHRLLSYSSVVPTSTFLLSDIRPRHAE